MRRARSHALSATAAAASSMTRTHSPSALGPSFHRGDSRDRRARMRKRPIAVCLCAALSQVAVGQQAGAWVQMASSGPPASARGSMVFDSTRGRVLLVTGETSPGTFSSTWEWDGAIWQLAFPCPPCSGAAELSAMAFDSQRGRATRFGGHFNGNIFGETWEWDGSAWSLLAVPGPSPRISNAMAYDASRGVTIMMGTNSFPLAVMETWAWDGQSWSQRTSTGGPALRTGHAMAYDAQRGRIVLFGGKGVGAAPAYPSDTWEWDGATWQQASSVGPPGRAELAMAYDSRRRRTILFGGYHYDSVSQSEIYPSNMWEWDGQLWVQSTMPTPPARRGLSMVFDEQRGRVVLFGGSTLESFNPRLRSDTWELVRPSVTATSNTFGPGCGNPVLTISAANGSIPLIGTAFVADITGIPGNVVAMAVGGSATSVGPFLLPVNLGLVGMPGCWQHHDAVLGLFFPCTIPSAGSAQCLLSVPSDPTLLNLHAYLQAWAPDPAANAFGVVTSNAIDLLIGNIY